MKMLYYFCTNLGRLKVFISLITSILILPVRFYQLAVSPYLHPSCRHIPTCSNYTIEALKMHGPIKGSWFAIRRILKCNPWGTSGFDPVPPKGHPFIKIKKINL